MPCIIPIEMIHYILLYNGTELYKSKNDNKMYVRFIPGIFTKTIGYLFNYVKFYPQCFWDSVTSTEIRRHHTSIRILIFSYPYADGYELSFLIKFRLRFTETVSDDHIHIETFYSGI